MAVGCARKSGASDAKSVLRNDMILRRFWQADDFARTSFEVRALSDLDNHETIGDLTYDTEPRK